MAGSETRRVAVNSIDEPTHQLRESIDIERLGELADCMAAEGLHQPIGLRGPLDGGRYEIVWGHRRYLAARLLEWDEIEAKVFAADFDPLMAAVSENLQREQMTPLEEARAVARFVEKGCPDAEIARRFRRSNAWVAGRRAILELPADLQAAIQQGAIPLNVARVLGDVDHERYRGELIAEAVRTGATAATADVWRAHYLADRDRIVRNNETVEEIAAARERWIIKIPCEACHAEFEYPATTTLRVCHRCAKDLRAAIDAAAAETAQK